MKSKITLSLLCLVITLGIFNASAFAQAEWLDNSGAPTNNVSDDIWREAFTKIGDVEPITRLDVRDGVILQSPDATGGSLPNTFTIMGRDAQNFGNFTDIYGFTAVDQGPFTAFGIFANDQPYIFWEGNDFRFSNQPGSAKMIIKDDGKVGIGTEQPLTQLDVRTGNIFTSPQVTGFGIVPSQFAALGVAGNGSPLACPVYGLGVSENNTVFAAGTKNSIATVYWSADDLNFESGCNNKVVTIKQNGQVGVGTDVPLTQFDVRGGNIFTSPTVTGSGVVPNKFAALGVAGNGAPQACPVYGLGVSENNTVFASGTKSGVATVYWSQDDLNFESGCGNRVVVFKQNGRVGIDNTSPNSILHVGDNTGARLSIGSNESIEDGGGNLLLVRNADWAPFDDNSRDLGTSFKRWDDVWATNGTIQTSDRRDKENITEITYGMDEILKLRPVSFTWKDRPDNGVKLGLIAQEVDEIIDEVVKQDIKIDEEGNEYLASDRYGMYYSDLIPVLIKGMQEEHAANVAKDAKITALEDRITQLENRLNENSTKSGGSVFGNEKAELFQNVPNPFDKETRIDYTLPATTTNAALYIYNMNGVQIAEYTNLEIGKGSITIEGATLNAGMYFYSLIADGQEVATKRMILTK